MTGYLTGFKRLFRIMMTACPVAPGHATPPGHPRLGPRKGLPYHVATPRHVVALSPVTWSMGDGHGTASSCPCARSGQYSPEQSFSRTESRRRAARNEALRCRRRRLRRDRLSFHQLSFQVTSLRRRGPELQFSAPVRTLTEQKSDSSPPA